ncbi:MAG: hypothetical protein ACTSYF_15185 [Promethearchaeota archaeon]
MAEDLRSSLRTSPALKFYDNRVIAKLNEFFIFKELRYFIKNSETSNDTMIFLQKRLFIVLCLILINVFFTIVLILINSSLMFQYILISLFLSLFFHYLVYYKYIYQYNKKISQQKIECETILPIIQFELQFLNNGMKRESDILILFIRSLLKILEGDLLKQFKEMYYHILIGQIPGKKITNLKTPSVKFNELLYKARDRDLIDLFDNKEKYSDFKVFLKTLESRMVIIIAEGIFLPIITIIFFLFNPLPYLNVIFPIFHWIIIRQVSSSLLSKNFTVIYKKLLTGRKYNIEFDEFIEFLDYFSIYLKANSPEIALYKTIRDSRKVLSFVKKDEYISLNSFSVKEFFLRLSSNTKSYAISLFCDVIQYLVSYSGERFAELISTFSKELKIQRELEKERTIILKSERFKIKILLIFFPVILSILSALVPIFMIDESFYSGSSTLGELFLFKINSFNFFLFFLMNLSYNYITTFYLTKISSYSLNHLYSIFSSVIFILIVLMLGGILPSVS